MEPSSRRKKSADADADLLLISDFWGKATRWFLPLREPHPWQLLPGTTVEILVKNPSVGEAKQRLRLDAKLLSLR